jgi:hypothetical protein
MTSNIRVGRGVLASAVVAMFLGLAVTQTFAQTATQEGAQADAARASLVYVPPTGGERLKWAVDGTFGATSIATGVFIASWNTAWNTPSEWGASWSGFGKRFGSREAQMTISNGIEAGLGTAWGEDPRYFSSGGTGFWSRTGYAAKTVFVAHRRSGQLAPAWARYIGAIGSNVVANTWLPSSSTTASQNVRRIGNGFLGRFVGNLWMEFWPDVRGRLVKRE